MLRLVKIRIPDPRKDELLEMLEDVETVDVWFEPASDHHCTAEILVPTGESESLVRSLEDKFGDNDAFRLVLLPVESTVPRADNEDDEEEPVDEELEPNGEQEKLAPINIEELYTDVTEGMAVDATYVTMVLLSTLVATVGIIRNDVTIVIAAMIIAPLLKPNMALSLATTLADLELAKRALKVNVSGLLLAIVVSIGAGILLPIDPTIGQIALRTKAGFLELILASGAGAAGALSFTSGEAGAVVGVMVAVALLPPVVVLGLLLGAGYSTLALGAAYLTVANIVCLNLAGVVTFFAQRIRPRTAWESKRAKSAFRTAVLWWLALLAILVAVVVFGETFRRYP